MWVFVLLSASCWILFIYPFLIYPLVLRLFSRRPVNAAPADFRVSLLFSAYNEIEALPDKLANLRQLKTSRPGLEILVYDDSSSDGTSELLAEAGDLVSVIQGAGRTGKAAGMKRLAAAASGEILVFTDANVRLAPDAIERLMPYYADPEVGGVCGTLKYVSPQSSTTSEVGSVYWRLEEMIRSRESASGDVMGADGSIFSVRKSLYPVFPDTVLDDFTVSMSVIFAGKRLIKAADVLAFENSVAHQDEEVRRKMRIGARAYHTHAYLRGQLRQMSALNRVKYVSHKLLRWFGGVSFVLGALFGLAAISFVSLGGAAGVAVLGALLFLISIRLRAGIISTVGEILLSTFATLFGVVQGMRGRTVATWSPAKSR